MEEPIVAVQEVVFDEDALREEYSNNLHHIVKKVRPKESDEDRAARIKAHIDKKIEREKLKPRDGETEEETKKRLNDYWDARKPADVHSAEFFEWCGKKGGANSKRKLKKKEARRMGKIREARRRERERPQMGPHCLKCDHLDNSCLLCSLKKCIREVANESAPSR